MPTASLIVNVDDDDAARYVKSRILKLAGFQVLEASTGAGALDMVRERAPGLVLLDVKLPDINGRDVCGMIKRDPGMSGVVVLLTSATHIDMRHRVLALDAGADGYLVAPMEPEELVANVRALLRMRKAERERQAAMEALQEADRRKDQFLAMLAHELRNPLAPIRNAVEIMRRSEDRQTHARAREVIGRQAEHLARLVDDLLEMSRITQGKVVLQRKPVTLASLVEAAVEVARPFVDKSAQHLEVHLPPTPIWLEVDPVRMSQVSATCCTTPPSSLPRAATSRSRRSATRKASRSPSPTTAWAFRRSCSPRCSTSSRRRTARSIARRAGSASAFPS